MEDKVFSEIMEGLNTYYRIITSYQNSPRKYGTDDLLYQTDVHVLQMIEENPGANLNELAAKSYRTKSAMSVLIKSLVEKGLVKRKRDVDDNRQYIITLTEKGELIHKFHTKLDCENYTRILSEMSNIEDISLEDLKSTVKVLEALNKELHRIHHSRRV
ncbi:MAG: MarR family transcriptional regulator [Tissierellaceae bacterium]|nr:MarR family transcriptional regulator [Tissierellaceae bacterium]